MDAFKMLGLLLVSNVFMTIAWYGHLKYKTKPLLLVILISWLIAFVEYCLQVPANRIGHGIFTAPQLKVIQEVLSFGVFTMFSYFYLKEKPTLYDSIAFGLIVVAVMISIMQPKA